MNLSACLPSSDASSECCHELASMGFRALQINLSAVSQEVAIADWKQATEKAGLTIDALFLDPLIRFGMREAPGTVQNEQAKQALHRATDVACKLGTRRLVLPCRGASGIRNRDDLLYTARYVRLACAVARRYGLEMILSDLPREAGTSLARSSGYPNIGLSLRLAPPFTIQDIVSDKRDTGNKPPFNTVPVREFRMESPLSKGISLIPDSLGSMLDRPDCSLVLEEPALRHRRSQQQAS